MIHVLATPLSTLKSYHFPQQPIMKNIFSLFFRFYFDKKKKNIAENS